MSEPLRCGWRFVLALLGPDRIGTDAASPYPPAIVATRKAGLMAATPLHYVTKHLQQGIESDHFRLKKNMPRTGGFQSFSTARRAIQGFEAMLWLRKGFGFAGAWTVREQNQLLAACFGLSSRTMRERRPGQPLLWPVSEFATRPHGTPHRLPLSGKGSLLLVLTT